jgi:hypothetical protein
MDSFARGCFRLSHRDQVAQAFLKKKGAIDQPDVPRSEVIQGKVCRALVLLYPAAFLFDEGQSLSLEIGHVNTPSTVLTIRHEGGDWTAERFAGGGVSFIGMGDLSYRAFDGAWSGEAGWFLRLNA